MIQTLGPANGLLRRGGSDAVGPPLTGLPKLQKSGFSVVLFWNEPSEVR